ATGEILRVIASSPTNLDTVLTAVATRAAHLCEARDAVIWRPDGDLLRAVAAVGPLAQDVASSMLVLPIGRGFQSGRAYVDREAVHIPDLGAVVETEFPDSASAFQLGQRAGLSVPLLREGTAIGVISIGRTEVGSFTDQQVALLQT